MHKFVTFCNLELPRTSWRAMRALKAIMDKNPNQIKPNPSQIKPNPAKIKSDPNPNQAKSNLKSKSNQNPAKSKSKSNPNQNLIKILGNPREIIGNPMKNQEILQKSQDFLRSSQPPCSVHCIVLYTALGSLHHTALPPPLERAERARLAQELRKSQDLLQIFLILTWISQDFLLFYQRFPRISQDFYQDFDLI